MADFVIISIEESGEETSVDCVITEKYLSKVELSTVRQSVIQGYGDVFDARDVAHVELVAFSQCRTAEDVQLALLEVVVRIVQIGSDTALKRSLILTANLRKKQALFLRGGGHFLYSKIGLLWL